jgi:hypothetical protein
VPKGFLDGTERFIGHWRGHSLLARSTTQRSCEQEELAIQRRTGISDEGDTKLALVFPVASPPQEINIKNVRTIRRNIETKAKTKIDFRPKLIKYINSKKFNVPIKSTNDSVLNTISTEINFSQM